MEIKGFDEPDRFTGALARFLLSPCTGGKRETMRTATSQSIETPASEPMSVTLLEVVRAVGDVTDNDHEVVATVLHLLVSGKIRLRGNFRGSSASDFS